MVDRKPEKLDRRRPAPDALKASVADARQRTLKRRHGPPMLLTRDPEGLLQWDWPFDDTDATDKDWKWLVVDAFGTRMEAVAEAFLCQLMKLCGQDWDEGNREWVPDEAELIQILHIASANRPRNESEAALAAQIAATHLLTMRVAEQVHKFPWDTRMIGAFAKLAQASVAQHEAMSGLKGKRRTARQKIEVRHEKHVHQHQHVHMHGGGAGDDRQSDAPVGSRTPKISGGAALPCPDQDGQVVPLPSRARKAGL